MLGGTETATYHITLILNHSLLSLSSLSIHSIDLFIYITLDENHTSFAATDDQILFFFIMAMSKETRMNGQNQSPQQQHQISSIPTGSEMNLPGNATKQSSTHKSTMQEASEQQLDAYAASFSSSNSQDRVQRLRRSQSPTWQRGSSVSARFAILMSLECVIGRGQELMIIDESVL